MARKNKKLKNKKKLTFDDWLNVISWKADIPWGICPNCKESEVTFLMYGELETRMGSGEVWCPKCFHGIHICRAKISEHLKMYSFEESKPFPAKKINYVN